MLAVISPAKTLDFDTPLATAKFSLPEFTKESGELVKNLKKIPPSGIAELMSISDKLAELNHRRFSEWRADFDNEAARAAILAFKGDVYLGLDAAAFGERDFSWMQKHLRILSGLHGLLRPLDRIRPYRLEMGTRLNTPKGKDLYAFWGDKITTALNAALQEQKSPILVNLASNEYFKAIHTDKVAGRILDVRFKEWRKGQYRIVSFSAKRARGLMARYMIEKRITTLDALAKFDLDGYTLNSAMSSDDTWLFTRETPAQTAPARK